MLKSKDLPTIYFILFLLINIIVIFKFVPPFYSLSTKSHLYVNKFEIKYLSSYLTDESLLFKICALLTQILFCAIVILLSSLIRQRISVPELKGEKWKNFCMILTAFGSTICFLSLLVYGNETLKFSRKLGNINTI